MNIGSSKGLTLDRVILYPTSQMIDWLKDEKITLHNKLSQNFTLGLLELDIV
jgi:hypothetical protein